MPASFQGLSLNDGATHMSRNGHTIRVSIGAAWLGCVLAYFAATYAADRSPANMADAANKFLSTLTAEQKQTAMFAFDNVKERERFGFVPTEMHPRVGLTIEKMTEPQRDALTMTVVVRRK